MRVLGITGGIATGKSTVTQMLADLGAPTISADALAHDLLFPGTPTTRAVLDAFPDCADPSDGARLTVDRRALGKIVFADPAARARLETLTHPAIIVALQEQIAAWRVSDQAPAAAAEIPLLFETKLEWLVDSIVVVTCSKSDQVSRMLVRGRSSEEEVSQQIAAQWPLSQKEVRADYLIRTDDFDIGMEDTRRQVESLWKTL